MSIMDCPQWTVIGEGQGWRVVCQGGGAGRMAVVAENVGPPATNRCHDTWQSMAVGSQMPRAAHCRQLGLPRYPLLAGALVGFARFPRFPLPPVRVTRSGGADRRLRRSDQRGDAGQGLAFHPFEEGAA